MQYEGFGSAYLCLNTNFKTHSNINNLDVVVHVGFLHTLTSGLSDLSVSLCR